MFFLILEIDQGLQCINQVQVLNNAGHHHFLHDIGLNHFSVVTMGTSQVYGTLNLAAP